MTMHKPFLAKFLISTLVACSLIACSVPAGQRALPAAASVASQQLGPGDTLGQMTLTTGSDQAVSIWTICHPATSLNAVSQTECRGPGRSLAIGPTGAGLAAVANGTPWERLQWTLLLDDQPVDLEAFGTFKFHQSQKGPTGHDAYFVYPAWDVVVAQPTVGRHTLRAAVQGLDQPGDAAGHGNTACAIYFNAQVKQALPRGSFPGRPRRSTGPTRYL